MSIKLCQAANSVVTPLDDAQLYSWIANRAVGVVTGCVVTSAGTNQLAISAGWGIVQGHVFTIGAETISAAVAPSGTVNGRLLIRIDTSDTVTPVEFVTQAETPLPALTQEDIDGSGSIYELPLATYDVGTISISGLTNVAPTADKRQTAANTPIVDAGSIITATNVEGALQELALAKARTKTGTATLVYYSNFELRASITFATPMADTNYAVVATSQDNYAGGGGQNGMSILSKTVNGFVVQQSDGRGLYTSGSVQHAAWIAIPYSNI